MVYLQLFILVYHYVPLFPPQIAKNDTHRI